jgi:hypothetical protein
MEMKRRTFLKSILGAFASLAIAQEIVLAKLPKIWTPPAPPTEITVRYGDMVHKELGYGTREELDSIADSWIKLCRDQLGPVPRFSTVSVEMKVVSY